MSSPSMARQVLIYGASPATSAFSSAVQSGSNIGDIASVATYATSTASTVNKLIDTVPSHYRVLLARILWDVQDIHSKLCALQKSFSVLEDYQMAGRWPHFIMGIHNPFEAIQPTKECCSSLTPKVAEAIGWFKLQKEADLCKLNKDWDTVEHSLGKYTENGNGINILTFFHDELAFAKELTPIWVAKAWDFTRIKYKKLSKKLEKKKALAEQAVNKMDIDPPASANWQKMIDPAVQAALRRNGPTTNTHKRGQVKRTPVKGNNATAPTAEKAAAQKSKSVKPSTLTAITKRKHVVSTFGLGPIKKKGEKT
ncbi:hypothetical protein HOY80DRAFT_1051834 [Tuber brumale]|nr:hypothetical protein HOY80DRAFT_1051834 [Tuber brumale]